MRCISLVSADMLKNHRIRYRGLYSLESFLSLILKGQKRTSLDDIL